MIKYFHKQSEKIDNEYLNNEKNFKWVNTVWKSHMIMSEQFNLIEYKITVPDSIRVKYLDKEDIESLGFVRDSIYSHKYKNDYYIEYNSKKSIHLDTIEIKNNQQTLFSGYIKNKSELKRLLKQLNIND